MYLFSYGSIKDMFKDSEKKETELKGNFELDTSSIFPVLRYSKKVNTISGCLLEISSKELKDIDKYENYPYLYDRIIIKINNVDAWVYIERKLFSLEDIIGHLKTLDVDSDYLWKIAYLMDWKFILDTERKMFNVQWYYDSNGAIVENIDIDKIKAKKLDLPSSYKDYLDFVLEKIDRLPSHMFINTYFSTYPIINGEKYTNLDLINSAKDYKEYLNKNKES